MKKPPLYLVNTGLACGVLYYVLDLSRPGRGLVDWTVIGLVVAAILWNLFQLGRRLHRFGGGRALWHLQRTLLLWIIGLLNTALIRPEKIGTWQNGLGWALLAVAALDTALLFQKERRSLGEPAGQT